MDTTQAEPQNDYMPIYRAYADNFERCFAVQANGILYCDKGTRHNAPLWYNAQRPLINLVVSIEPPMLVLREPHQGDPATISNWNKTEMTRAYTFALIVYHKICDLMRRPKVTGYTSYVQIDA